MKRRLRKSVVRTLKFTLAMMMLFTTVNNIPMTVIADDFAEETTDVLPTEEPTTVESSEPAVEPQPEVLPEEPVVEETPVVEEVPTPEVVPSVEPTVVPTETPEVEPTVAPTATPVVETTDDKELDEEDEVVATVVPTTEPVVIETPEVKVEDTLTYDFDFESQDIMEPTKGFVGDVVKVAENTLVREGYNFLYWYVLNEDGTETIYNANDEYTLTDKDDVLTAKWEEVVVEEPVETEVTETEETTPVRPMMLANPNEEEKEYPEYITSQQQGNKGYANHEPSYLNNSEHETLDMYKDITKHYINFMYTIDENVYAYVRCDVYQNEIAPNLPEDSDPTKQHFDVFYENENGNQLGREIVESGKTPVKVPKLEMEGYWTLEGNTEPVEPKTEKITGATTFVWHEVVKYTVTYNSNNGQSSVEKIDGTKYDEKQMVEVKGNIFGFEKEGYTFDGWNTEANGNGTDYKENDKFEINKNVTLYAQWLEDKKPEPEVEPSTVYIYVKVETEDGTVPSDLIINKDGYYTIGKTTLPIESAENYNHGYKIEGEDLNKLGLENIVIERYVNNTSVPQEKIVWKELNVSWGARDYLPESDGSKQWHLDGVIKYSNLIENTLPIKFHLNYDYDKDGTNDIDEYKLLKGSKLPEYLNAEKLDRHGYVFGGWYIDENFNNKYIAGQESDENAVEYNVYAKWDIDTNVKDTKYTIHFINKENGENIQKSVEKYGYIGEEIILNDGNFEIDGYYQSKDNPTKYVLEENKANDIYLYYLIKHFRVEWRNSDERNTLLEIDYDVPYGKEPEYDGKMPSKESDKEYHYTFDGWSPELSPVTEDVTYTAKYKTEKRKYGYKIKYYYDNKLGNPYSENAPTGGEAEYGSIVSIIPEEKVTYNGVNYILVSTTHQDNIQEYPGKNNINVYYEKDENNDGVLDKFQIDVTFVAKNGGFNGDVNNKLITFKATLTDKNGNPSEKGSYKLTIDKVPLTNAPDEGYATSITEKDNFGYYEKKAEWSPKLAVLTNGSTILKQSKTYTFAYLEDVLPAKSIAVKHFTEDLNGFIQYPTLKNEIIGPLTIKKNNPNYILDETVFARYSLMVEEVQGYCFDRLELRAKENYSLGTYDLMGIINPNTVTVGYTVDFSDVNCYEFAYIYAIDANDNNIPDKYEATVTYKVVNGYFNGDAELVEIVQKYPLKEKGTDGIWKDVQATLTNIPTVEANTGYKAGSWDIEPTSETQVVDDVTYTYTFVRDDAQQKSFSYTVNHIVDGTIRDTDTITYDTWVNDEDPTKLLVKPIEYKEYKDYTVDTAATVIPTYVTKGENGFEVINVYYAKDVEGGEKPEQGDGTPDKYQVKVTYGVVNGEWNEGSAATKYEYVTLYKDGKMAEDGQGELKTVPAAGEKPVYGYMAGIWQGGLPTVVTKDSAKEYTYHYLPDETITHSISAQVGYYIGDTLEDAKAAQYPIMAEDVVTATDWIGNKVSVTVTPDPEVKVTGYKLVETDGETTFTYDAFKTSDEVHQVKAYYVKDETQTQPTNYFVNYSQDGVLVEQDSYEVKSTAWVNDYPAMISVEDINAADDRYVGYKLDPKNEIPEVGTLVESGTTIKVNYVRDDAQQKSFSYTVNHIVDGETRDTDTVTTSVWVNDEDLTVLDVQDINYRTYEGYVVDTTATVIPETIAVDGVINVYYEADATGTDPNNPTTPDGTPDKYQVMVDYNAVNGTVSPDFFYVTLTKDGKYASAEDGGSYVLTAEDLPTTSANAGYQNGTWDVTPVTGMAITKDTVFTVTYTATPVAPVTPPVNANPQPNEPVFTCPEGTVWNEATGMCEVIPAPAVAPVVPVGPADDDTDVEPVEPDQEIVEVEDEDTPQTGGDVEIIEDDVTPEVGFKGSWALINLIATVLGAVLAVILLVSKHDKTEEDEENPEAAEVEYTRRRKWKVISTVVAILSIVVFFLTENMRLPMVWVDKWTLVMVLFFLVNAVSLYMGRRFHEVEDEEESTNA